MPRNAKAVKRGIRASMGRNRPLPAHKAPRGTYTVGSTGMFALRTAKQVNVPLRVTFADRDSNGRNLSPSRLRKLQRVLETALRDDPEHEWISGSVVEGLAVFATSLDAFDLREAFWFVEGAVPTIDGTVIDAESRGTSQHGTPARRRDYSARRGEGSAEPHLDGIVTTEERDRTDSRRSERSRTGTLIPIRAPFHRDTHSSRG